MKAMVRVPIGQLYAQNQIATQVLYGFSGDARHHTSEVIVIQCSFTESQQFEACIAAEECVFDDEVPPLTEKVVVVARKPSTYLHTEPSYNCLTIQPAFLGTVFSWSDQAVKRPYGNFFEVYITSSKKAWIPQEDVFLRSSADPFPKPNDAREIVEFVETHLLGDHYQWGGVTCVGWDCSGLTNTVARVFGVTIPRSSIIQWRAPCGVCSVNSTELLQIGDFLYFKGPTWNHCGIYDGQGGLIHAEGVKEVKVCRWKLTDPRLQDLQFLGAKRLW